MADLKQLVVVVRELREQRDDRDEEAAADPDDCGADIVEELAASGELERTLEDKLGPDYRDRGAERVVAIASPV